MFLDVCFRLGCMYVVHVQGKQGKGVGEGGKGAGIPGAGGHGEVSAAEGRGGRMGDEGGFGRAGHNGGLHTTCRTRTYREHAGLRRM